jgi:hypothetical protein
MKTFVTIAMTILLSAVAGAPARAGGDCDPGTFEGAIDDQVTVCQGWDAEQQQAFWFTAQGSNIMPYAWFLNLEQVNSAAPFTSADNVDAYRYLPQKASAKNPDALPIGFTKDSTLVGGNNGKISKTWLGVTCAACHTGQLEYGDRKVLIDGAPAMAGFQGFFEDMTAGMRATLNIQAKFDRFAARVIKYNQAHPDDAGTTDKDALRGQLNMVTAGLEKRNALNSGSIRFGNARLDALGSILNQVQLATGQPIEEGRVDAPVSYPFIWDTPQHDRVQWNLVAANPGLGAMGRNVGEVVGVFGEVNLGRLQSSMDVANLGHLEQLMWELEPPKWKDVWAGTDAAFTNPYLVEMGENIYAETCMGCHESIDSGEDREFEFEAKAVPLEVVKTDPRMAMNFVKRIKSVGLLTKSVGGLILGAIVADKDAALVTIKAGQPTEYVDIIDAKAKEFLSGGVNLGTAKAFADAVGEATAEDPPVTCFANPDELCYKARPLDGVWATAPYLHNGSVRTIRQLLIPSERQTVFNVGSRSYDPKTLGFLDAGNTVLDTTLAGNSNAGHEMYGRKFEGAAGNGRALALLEYLKTL